MASRMVVGVIETPDSKPWPDYAIQISVHPTQYTIEAHYPGSSIVVITQADGTFSVSLEQGITYHVRLIGPRVRNENTPDPTRGRDEFDITIPFGDTPISLEGIRAEPVDVGDPTLNDFVFNHLADEGNPHNVTASQTGAYTTGEVDTFISEVQAGAIQWGAIEGNLPEQDDLRLALNAKADVIALGAHVEDTANPHQVTSEQIGLGAVPNVDATDRASHTGTQLAETISDFDVAADARIAVQAGQPNGLATLTDLGVVPTSQIPALSMTDVHIVASEAEQIALVAEEGDVVIRTDQSLTYLHNGGDTGTMSDWTELATPTDVVTSVNGQIGVVVLGADDVGLGAVENLAPADLPVSTAQQAALDTKADVGHGHQIGDVEGLQAELDSSGVELAGDGVADTAARSDHQHSPADKTDTIAIGSPADGVNTSTSATLIGREIVSDRNYITAVGRGSRATADGGSSLGYGAHATGMSATAIGENARASGMYGIAIGSGAQCGGIRGVAIGGGADHSDDDTTVIAANDLDVRRSDANVGKTRLALSSETGVKKWVSVNDENAIEVDGVAVGGGPELAGDGTAETAARSDHGHAGTSEYSIAIGTALSSASSYGVMIGYQAAGTHGWDVAIGVQASAFQSAVGIGGRANANRIGSIAIGAYAKSHQDRSIALGNGAIANVLDTTVIKSNDLDMQRSNGTGETRMSLYTADGTKLWLSAQDNGDGTYTPILTPA